MCGTRTRWERSDVVLCGEVAVILVMVVSTGWKDNVRWGLQPQPCLALLCPVRICSSASICPNYSVDLFSRLITLWVYLSLQI